MKINSASAWAWVVPSHVRIVEIDTSINHIVYWAFPEDLINFKSQSIQYVHSEYEYAFLNQKAEELLNTQHGDIKIVIDIVWRSPDWRLVWNLYIYDIVKEYWNMIWLTKRISVELNKTDTLRWRTGTNVNWLTVADDGNNGEMY